MRKNHDVTVFYDDRVLNHNPDVEADFVAGRLDKRIRQILSTLNVPWKYPEHPGRLNAILAQLEREPIPGLTLEGGRVATRDQLARVHTTNYLDALHALRGQHAWLDVDTTAVSPGSVEAAEVAAGTAIAAVDAVCQGRTGSAFALVRPPGHHAEPTRARGFCLLNNVAVAATYAQSEAGIERVMILDWDAHHGNGTQDIFWADPDVLFVDIHRAAPFYPGTGYLEEIGAGLGEGTTVNIPLPGGSGDVAYLKALRDIVVPAADYFEPDLILVSAGFDTHWYDLAMNVSHEGFAAMTSLVQSLARQHCDGKLVFVLEGGYNVDALAPSVHAVLRTLAGEPPSEPRVCGIEEVEQAAAFHRGAFVREDSNSDR